MGLIAKLKFKLRKRLAQGTADVQEYVFTGSALASATDQLAVNMNSISFQQAPRGIDRGRNQSFFAMNAPQGTPFAAAGALHMPFPSQLHQQPFTGQQFGPRHDSQQSRTSVQDVHSHLSIRAE
ncbi:hypothetical protein FocTR4_00013299 [Fusarium oxysporum f. sp. cubense]|uniref:Uncharacterized protein n=1 Tax=Fusarium oxysporum f. sp. cubense TaxID=61366 RepID=A0A5C6SL49_FUSOC|nr:hypothetical protein FocTR4_00013299 [Fusarium oxysporum f. sp. cubense]